jgi:hypothetical protein
MGNFRGREDGEGARRLTVVELYVASGLTMPSAWWCSRGQGERQGVTIG